MPYSSKREIRDAMEGPQPDHSKFQCYNGHKMEVEDKLQRCVVEESLVGSRLTKRLAERHFITISITMG